MSDIGELLRFDPLDAAEKITGQDHKTDEGTMGLGFLMHMDHGTKKRKALEATDDTYWGITFDEALRVVQSEGFEIVYDEPFTGTKWGDEPAPIERYIVLWHSDGILAHLESHGGTSLNSAGMNYAIRFPEGYTSDWTLRSSSKYVGPEGDPVMCGHHDIREGFRYNLNRLRAAGTFVTPWPDRMMFSLANYSTRGGDYNAETARVEALLPESVRASIHKQEES